MIPLAKAHGAALIALTIDEVGMAKTAERKVEIAKRIRDIACDEHGLDPELLIFDALTFTLTTGDEEWRPSAVETIEGIRRIKAEIPGVKTSLGVSNVSFGVSPVGARGAQLGVPPPLRGGGSRPRDGQPEPHHPVRRDRPRTSASSPTTSCSTAARTRSSASSATSSRRASRSRRRAWTPPPTWSPRRRSTGTSCAARRTAWRTGSTSSVEKIGAVPTLNQVLLPAMKEVGDKFGAGELILPFVLQSAEVMKRAVAQLENYLDRIEGHTKGKVVIATVFGDVHDIGKSLVNTILTNNGYTVIDLGKQVPVDTIINAAVENEADAIGLSALLVSTSKQMPTCVQELHQRGLEFPVLIGGAAINRDFGRRILYPHGQGVRRGLRAGRLLLQGRLPGARHHGRPRRGGGARRAGREDAATRPASCARRWRSWMTAPPLTTTPCARRSAPTCPCPSRRSGARARWPVDLDAVFPYLDRHVLFKLHWGGRGKKGEEWRRIVEGDGEEEGFAPRLERMWREQEYLHPRAKIGYFPAASEGNELIVFDPEDPERELERLRFPRQPRHDRICLSDLYRPVDSGERDVVVLQGVTVGDEVTELMARLERDGEFAEQLYTHGLGVQTAEGLAEWLHAEARRELGIDADQGRRYSWGYPACPDQSEHEKVWRLLGLEEIGMTLSDGFAVMPEQSTVAIIAHHPQAVYFGMKSGFVPADKRPDELIAGTDRGGELPPEVDPADGAVEAEVDQPDEGPA